ncbi:MAG: PIN domain-containing protein [Cyanobacteria bacterium]|nr:PIN domain-containing protein [Cyanobacteria bacterium GSL.Bin1]
MNEVFVDTAAWLALLNKSDSFHPKAKDVEKSLQANRRLWVTTDFILIEVADALCSVSQRSQTAKLIKNLKRLKSVLVVALDPELLEQGLALYESRLDKDWGLTDCISFVVMQQRGITEAFTSDRHFEQAGFIRLMKP